MKVTCVVQLTAFDNDGVCRIPVCFIAMKVVLWKASVVTNMTFDKLNRVWLYLRNSFKRKSKHTPLHFTPHICLCWQKRLSRSRRNPTQGVPHRGPPPNRCSCTAYRDGLFCLQGTTAEPKWMRIIVRPHLAPTHPIWTSSSPTHTKVQWALSATYT